MAEATRLRYSYTYLRPLAVALRCSCGHCFSPHCLFSIHLGSRAINLACRLLLFTWIFAPPPPIAANPRTPCSHLRPRYDPHHSLRMSLSAATHIIASLLSCYPPSRLLPHPRPFSVVRFRNQSHVWCRRGIAGPLGFVLC